MGVVTNTVVVQGIEFNPKVVTIHAGDSILWDVRQGYHTITPDTGTTEPFCGTFEYYPGYSPPCIKKFSTVGTFQYYCVIHGQTAGMVGTIQVLAAPNNVRPSVSILTPISGSTLSFFPTNFFQATATDSDGTVQKVDFLFGFDSASVTNFLGSVTNNLTNNIFTLAVTNPLPIAANVILSAKATDDRGGETLSLQRNFNTGPFLILKTNNATLFGFQVLAPTGLIYQLEGSSNLTNWISLITITNSSTTNISNFDDPGAATNVLRFYRAKVLP